MIIVRAIWCVAMTSTLCFAPALGSPVGSKTRLGVESISIAFTTDNGWKYDGRIELPASGNRNGWGVMLLGGGLGTSIDWFLPGELAIDGRPTRDADTIANALLDAGFVVARWQAIRRDDPKHAEDPLMIDSPPVRQTIEQALKALAAFQEKNLVPVHRTFLLGHSLGAWRASVLLEENPTIPGVVMLAGARLILSDLDEVRKIAQQAEGTFATKGKTVGNDRHEWVLRQLDRAADRWQKPVTNAKGKYGHRIAVDVIASLKTPTLLIVGELDERWRLESYLVTHHLRAAKHPDYTWRIIDGIGHNLGPEVPGPVEYRDMGVVAHFRSGPISPRVVNDVVTWLRHRAR